MTDFQDLEDVTGKYETITSALILNFFQNHICTTPTQKKLKCFEQQQPWTSAGRKGSRADTSSTLPLGITESLLHKSKSPTRFFCLTKNVKLI